MIFLGISVIHDLFFIFRKNIVVLGRVLVFYTKFIIVLYDGE